PDRDKAYTPIERMSDGRHAAAPLYYGMLSFAQTARGVLVPARIEPASPDLKAYAVRADGGRLRVAVINTSAAQSARVTLSPRRRFERARLMRLTGSAIDATTGVTLGGASVDEFGGWSPEEEDVVVNNDEVAIDVPAASAVTVRSDL